MLTWLVWSTACKLLVWLMRNDSSNALHIVSSNDLRMGPTGMLHLMDSLTHTTKLVALVYQSFDSLQLMVDLSMFYVYIGHGVKSEEKKKAHACIDGSKHATPWLQQFAQTYASCMKQPCMHLLLLLLIPAMPFSSHCLQQSNVTCR